jgi:diacylglycerol kinase family enzyme
MRASRPHPAITAKGVTAWLRAFGRLAAGAPDRSPFVRTTVARRIDVRLDRKLPYELDGGARGERKKLTIKVRPGAIRIAVPAT